MISERPDVTKEISGLFKNQKVGKTKCLPFRNNTVNSLVEKTKHKFLILLKINKQKNKQMTKLKST